MEEDQAGPDPGISRVALAGLDPEPTHDEFMVDLYPKVQEILKFSADEHVILEDPLSSTGTLSSMKNLEDAYAIEDQFINDKSTNDEPRKLNLEDEVVSMVTVPIYQASSSVPPLSTPVIDLSPHKHASSTTQTPIFTATTTTTTTPLPPPPQQQSTTESELAERVAALEKKLSDLEKTNKNLDNTTQNLGSRVYTLELRDLPHKINEAVRENVKEAVQIALQAPLRDRFRDLSEEDMKEMLHQRMFEAGSYKSLPEHIALYEALEASMERAQRDEFLIEKDKSHKRRRDDQDPPPPPPDSDQNAPSSSSKQQSGPHTEQPVDDIPIQDSDNISDSEDTDSAHLPKTKHRPEWLKPIPATTYQAPAENSLLEKTEDMRTFMNWYYQKIGKTELTQADLEGQAYEVVKPFYPDVVHLHFHMEECHKGSRQALSISKIKAALYHDFGIELLKFYIDRHTAESSRKVVRTHMRILSVVRIKAYSRYGYNYLKEITLRRSDHQEYTIAKKDFKNLYPSDFEDLNLLLLQGHLNHLPGSDIRFEFKHDYTIIDSPCAVVFPVSNNEQKIMRFNEIYKFSDGTLTNIMEALDYRVKEYKVNRLNLGMNTLFWTNKDVERNKEFIHVRDGRTGVNGLRRLEDQKVSERGGEGYRLAERCRECAEWRPQGFVNKKEVSRAVRWVLGERLCTVARDSAWPSENGENGGALFNICDTDAGRRGGEWEEEGREFVRAVRIRLGWMGLSGAEMEDDASVGITGGRLIVHGVELVLTRISRRWSWGIKAYSRYGYDYLKEITLRRADHQEYTIAEKDFKNLYPSDFEDLNMLLLQGHLNHLPGLDMLSTAVKL
ncbi:hypothetical protein Tco_1162207 [Tanacetum coccineum]